jgi:hypothetical protein
MFSFSFSHYKNPIKPDPIKIVAQFWEKGCIIFALLPFSEQLKKCKTIICHNALYFLEFWDLG